MPDGTTGDNKKFVNFLDEKGRWGGILSWIFSTDHKRIGLMYLGTMMLFFVVGAAMGVLMRLELFSPGKDFFEPQTYNALFTLHGMIMIFLFVIPGLPAVFGNFFLPIMIGAKDVAFPKLNLLSYWLFLTGALLATYTLLSGSGPPDTGWTFYAPYSIRSTTSVSLAVFAGFILGFSSILTGLNFVTTVHRLRAPGMGWFQMPLFPWALYSTAWIQVLATPVLAITLILVILERQFGIGIFDPAKGGDPILYQHLFWIYSHPAVYIMILPGMGAISEIISCFSKKPVFGYKSMVYALLLIAFVGYLVWGHHMFVSGQSDTAVIVFSLLTFLVAIPSGIKIFNWLGTMYKGSITMEVPMVYALSFIFLFSIGGLTGLVLGALASDVHVHDTYFVVGHFHHVMFGGTGFAFFAAIHFWFPKMFGKMYNKTAAMIGWFFFFVGFELLYLPMLVIGIMGNPRRYYDYPPQYELGHQWSTIGAWVLVFGLAIIIINLIKALFNKEPAPHNPWGAATLEWTVPSPPSLENFDEVPVLKDYDPYDYSRVKEEE